MTSSWKWRLSTGLPIILLILLLVVLANARQGRAGVMQNGFYTAEAKDFDSKGWKEYVTIYVSKNTIITVDYNAKNASGFIKSWDMEYMRKMNATDGTYPNKYTREYAEALINRQDPDKVDAISGATHSHVSFQQLVRAVVAQARAGDPNVIYVDLTTTSNP